VNREAREALIDSIEDGDLIRLNGTLRVARSVSRREGRVKSITFAIRRCSWTRRPYTVVGRTDMYLKPLEIVAKGFGLCHGPLDMFLQSDVEARGGPSLLQCCDVIGIVT
jgi:hypothetical protein